MEAKVNLTEEWAEKKKKAHLSGGEKWITAKTLCSQRERFCAGCQILKEHLYRGDPAEIC